MKIKAWRQLFKKIFIGLLDLFFPVICLFCSTQTDQGTTSPVPICRDHRGKLESLNPPCCRLCGLPLSHPSTKPFAQICQQTDETSLPLEASVCGNCRTSETEFKFVLAGFAYRNKVQQIVHEWKYKLNGFWGQWLGYRLGELLAGRFEPENWDCLVPVPLHRDKYEQRGFNQADQLAGALAELFELDHQNWLRKIRKTQPQAELSREQRVKNVRACFQVKKENVAAPQGSRILVVDDVYTTGATLESAGKTLLEAGGERIGGLVLTRTLPEPEHRNV